MSELLHFIQDREAAFRSQARLGSLYSDFSAQKTLNPDGYTANLNSWKKALFAAGRAGKIPNTAADASNKGAKEGASAPTDLLSFSTGEELGRALELRPYGRPTGLQEVFKDAVERKEIVPLKEYLAQEESIYSRRWIPTPWEVVKWGLRSLGLGILYGQSNLTIGNFVVVENVEATAKSVLEKHQELNTSPIGTVYSLSTFTETFKHALGAEIFLSASDIQVLLRYMSRDRPSLSYDNLRQTVRFSPLGVSKPPPITENDISVAQIKSLQLSLSEAIFALDTRYTDLDNRLRDAVSKKQMSSARSLLKARKLIEKTLEQRRLNLLQVEESLHSIETAATNVDIISAMQAGSEVLRDLNAKVGGVEGVERITDALREEVNTQEDISRVMAEPGMGADNIDESEVDEEFEALVRKENEEREKVEEQQKQNEIAEMRAKMKELEEWEAKQKAKREAEADASLQGQPEPAKLTQDENPEVERDILKVSQELERVNLSRETNGSEPETVNSKENDERDKTKVLEESQLQLAT